MKIDKKIERKDLTFYIVVYIILGFLLLLGIACIISIIIFLSDSYQEALQECVNKGYSASFCRSLLN
mgnify:CR=1 FL=1